MKQKISFKAKVQRFPGKMGWFYVQVPKNLIPKNLPVVNRWQFVKIKAQIGKTEWNTSLLPKGGGESFIALKAPIRKKEGVKLSDEIEITFEVLF